MKITIVTPSFNQAAFLDRAIRSIQEQRGDFELEHLVVDGGSTDESVDVLKRWEGRLWYVSEKDRGQSHALNKGLARATGEVIGWINSDDMLLPGALDQATRYFREHPERRWMYGRCRIIDEGDREIRRFVTWYKNRLMRPFSYTRLLIENYISQPSTFFRRDLFEEVGGVDETLKYDMDYDLFLRFGLVAEPGILDDELACFRFYTGCKTGGAIDETLRVANAIATKYARQIGKPWAARANYWFYYRRTSLIYRLLAAAGR